MVGWLGFLFWLFGLVGWVFCFWLLDLVCGWFGLLFVGLAWFFVGLDFGFWLVLVVWFGWLSFLFLVA